MKKNPGRIWTLVTLILLFICIVVSLFMFRQQILQKIGNFLIVTSDLYPVDVIHVIAGDDYRTEYAIQLYKQGYAKYIFFTGGWCKIHGWDHGIHGQQLALSRGIPLEAIAVDDASVTSTYSEIVRLNAWIEQGSDPVRSVIMVSDPFHMRRTMWTSHFVLGDEIRVLSAPIPFDQTPYTSQWWLDGPSEKYVKDEYIKLAYYFLRYQLSMEWLASLDKD